ncbi:MAG: DUF3043 domain-containing protein [Candidatus Nanopelagicaceae bacterium]|jgi:hypothetical protein|nr:DUF3043 domain-containing protein [Actinomycetales bacterium]
MSEKKGRPTPKRKEAEKERVLKRLAPAATKEAKKLQKKQSRIARGAQREAYMRGEESALPPRDRGPIRKFVRDYVDARRSIGEFFLPVIVLVLFMTIVPVIQVQLAAIILMYSILGLSFIDGFYLSRKIKREVAKRFPGENLKGVGMYGWLRSTQIRRLRAPLPRVTRGTKL